MKPEYRLPHLVFGGLVLPIGLFLYGWTAQEAIFWIAPIIGTAILSFGVVLIFISTKTYLVDAFPLHAASALTAGSILQSVFAAVIPLAGPPLFNNLGLGWGTSVLGFIALVFIPVPLLLIRYGEKYRAAKNGAEMRASEGVLGQQVDEVVTLEDGPLKS